MAVIGVGVLMIVYVVFGGMLATTWVQIIKAILLMSGSIFLTVLVLQRFDFSLAKFFASLTAISSTEGGATVTRNFLTPGLLFKNPLDQISLGLALIFGTRGASAHPHPVLYRARRQDRPGQRHLGHDHHRPVLYHDDFLRVWSGQPARA